VVDVVAPEGQADALVLVDAPGDSDDPGARVCCVHAFPYFLLVNVNSDRCSSTHPLPLLFFVLSLMT